MRNGPRQRVSLERSCGCEVVIDWKEGVGQTTSWTIYLFVNRLLLSIGVITAHIPIPNFVFPYEAISIGRHASDPMSTTILQQGIE